MVIIKGLVKKYGKFTAVDNLNMEVKEGEFFGLLGPNGAGKTTTIRIISALTAATSGSIVIDGQPMDRNLISVKRKIGLVPQYINLEDEMTVWENLELHGRLYGMPKVVRRKKIEELLEFVELNDKAHDLVKTLSGGMKRKLMIARALMHEPKLILLDEPTVGLDPAMRRKIWDLLKDLNGKGLTILMTTHYIEEAESLCEYVGLMDKGKLIEVGSPADLIAKAGNFVVEFFENGRTKVKFFETRAEAIAFADKVQGNVNIRFSNLEDVFIKLTNRRVEG